MRPSRVRLLSLAAAAAVAHLVHATVAAAQKPAPATAGAEVITKSFGDLAQGPYKSLVIRNAMVIPGHGGPPAGPYDIMIEGNMITQMIPFDLVAAERSGSRTRMTGDRVIDAEGKYIMPGMIDLHTHIRTLPEEIE